LLKSIAWHESNHFEGKEIEKELARLGFELTTFMLEDEGAIHYTMDP
jgi:hypothetical protein